MKYRFRDRATAEAAVVQAERERDDALIVLSAIIAGKAKKFRAGPFSAQLVVRPVSGRSLLALTFAPKGQSPITSVHVAEEWAAWIQRDYWNHVDSEARALQELARRIRGATEEMEHAVIAATKEV